MVTSTGRWVWSHQQVGGCGYINRLVGVVTSTDVCDDVVALLVAVG